MKEYQVNARVKSIKWLHCSYYGNPKAHIVIRTTKGQYIQGNTGTDCACAYAVDNYQKRTGCFTYHYTSTGNIIFTQITDYKKGKKL